MHQVAMAQAARLTVAPSAGRFSSMPITFRFACIALVALLILCHTVSIFAADWKMAPPQLKTRWTQEVSPTNARLEYPRPQMVRKDWQNLNGVWEFQIGEM